MKALTGLATIATCVLALLTGGCDYCSLEVCEPARTKGMLAAFERGEPTAWDTYKMHPPVSKRAVPALLDGLKSTNPTVRERAVVGLCGLSREPEVVAAIRRLSRDPNRASRQAAQVCLRATYGIQDEL